MIDNLPVAERLQQLAQLIRRHAPTDGTYQTLLEPLLLMHATQLSEPIETVHKPSICIVAQGAKTATHADETYRYDPSNYLVLSIEVPTIGRIIEATPETPYLSLKLTFDTDVILDVAKSMDDPLPRSAEASRGITLNRVSPELLEACVRLMQLLDTPRDLKVIAPLVIREVLYRVLQSEHGSFLRQFGMIGSHSHSIAQAIQLINRQYNRPIMIEQLAQSVNLSTSAFHKHFKRVTSMSPLQYQKTVRLQEARRLMLSEAMLASDAAYQVGYESPSQFSREYTRKYGRPPMLDTHRESLNSH